MVIICHLFLFNRSTPGLVVSPYPNGLDFAYSITDDPDYHTVEVIQPVYELFAELGLRTTVLVWTNEAKHSNGYPEQDGDYYFGETCQNPVYLKYIHSLQSRGFEIGLHTVSHGNDYREETIEGYETFKQLFGAYPKMNIMHYHNLENVYWGNNIFPSGLPHKLMRFVAKTPYAGENPDSPYFWGDILKEKTKYVRMWGSSDINTLRFNPSMPYKVSEKPYVNYYFSFSNGSNGPIFEKLMLKKNVDRLVKQRGISIVYAHLAAEFTEKDTAGNVVLRPLFEKQMRYLASQKGGWFVPVSDILDRLLNINNIIVHETENAFVITNTNKEDVDGVTLIVNNNMSLFNENGVQLIPNDQNEIMIGDMSAKSVYVIYKSKENESIRNLEIGHWEKSKLIFGRSIMLLKNRINGIRNSGG